MKGSGILAVLLILLVVAFFTTAQLFLYLFYALCGLFFLGRLWAKRSLQAVSVTRHYDRRAFLGEMVSVELEVCNKSRLPVLWLQLSEAVPAELITSAPFQHVLSLLPRERRKLTYTLNGRRRGYYRFGQLAVQGGDLLGTASYETRQAQGGYLVVYPRIVGLSGLGLPSLSPFGTLPAHERLYEDPARPRGVRDYQPGDSLRRMDWKTTARVGSLQVRRAEPAIALETAVVLNLDGADYPLSSRYQATELAITIAASVAVQVAEQRQAVGLATNGHDPLSAEDRGTGGEEPAIGSSAIPLRKGREHLMHLLDLLARIEVSPAGQALPFLDLLSQGSAGLPWGSTVLAVTSREVEGLMEALLALRRRGLAVLLVLTTPDRDIALTTARAGRIGVRAVQISSERELKDFSEARHTYG